MQFVPARPALFYAGALSTLCFSPELRAIGHTADFDLVRSATSLTELQHPTTARFHQEGSYSLHDHRYCSPSEAACGELLQRHVPGFRIETFVSHQVPIGLNREHDLLTADFKVGDVLIEYHPVRFWRNGGRYGDFATPREYFDYRRQLERLPEAERPRLKAETRSRLEQHYYERRRNVIDRHPELSGCELIVAGLPEDFYQKVIRRFAPTPPSPADFLEEFTELQTRVTPVERTAPAAD